MGVRVLWVIKGLGPGGAERLLVSLAAAHDPSVATFECSYVVPWKRHLVPELEQRGVPCRCVGRAGRDLLWPLRLARLVRSGRYDVIHVHSPLPGSVARLAVRTMRPSARPTVFTTEHNAWGTFRLPTRWLNRVTGRRDEHTFAVSAEVLGSMRGPVIERTSVLVHGVDQGEIDAARAQRDAMRRSLGVGPDETLAVTVANFRKQKDYPTLLRAFARLGVRGVPVRLVAVGQGPLEDEMRELHDSLGLGDRVQLLGYRADPVDVLAAGDLFVLASKWEGMPVALMEATTLGLPAVLTEVGGMPDAMGKSGASWVSPGDVVGLADAIEDVVVDRVRRSELAVRSTEVARSFDIRRAAREIEQWYAPPVPRWTPPVGLEGITLRRAEGADEDAAIELCRQVLGHEDDGRWAELFHWKHRDNPFGRSPMWVAVDGDRIVAVRVFLRWEFRLGDRTVRAVRAVDTATHPDYQGKGLFTALTLAGLAEVAAEGVELVYNTPNAKSRPGYLKMGWHDVGRLAPVVAVRSPLVLRRLMKSRVAASVWPDHLAIGRSVHEWLADGGFDRYATSTDRRGLTTPLSPEFLRWRFGSSVQPCRVIDDGTAAVVVERRARGDMLELDCLLALGDPRAVDRLLRRTLADAGADVVMRLGAPNPLAGFTPLPRTGPMLTCRMLRPDPVPRLADWHLSLGDVVLF